MRPSCPPCSHLPLGQLWKGVEVGVLRLPHHFLLWFGKWWKLEGLELRTLPSSSASVFYGGPLGDNKDREALISLIHACLSPSRGSWDQPHTPQYLLATLIPSPGKLHQVSVLGWGKAV